MLKDAHDFINKLLILNKQKRRSKMSYNSYSVPTIQMISQYNATETPHNDIPRVIVSVLPIIDELK